MVEGKEKIGQVGFDLLDQIEKLYGPGGQYGEDEVPNWRPPRIHQVMTVTEVEYTDEDGDRSTYVLYDYDEARPIVRHGLVVNLARATGVIR